MTVKILAVITARGGSKAIPYKNIKPLAGKPLIAYTIEAASQLISLYRVIVSTDDADIKAVSEQYGAAVPFLRPAELATDEADSLSVLRHAVNTIEQRDATLIDWVLLLQPTSPLRTAADMQAAIDLGLAGNCDSVIAVVDASHHHPAKLRTINSGFLQTYLTTHDEPLPRQALTPVYKVNGAIYLVKRDLLFMKTGYAVYGDRIKPYLMSAERSIDIDTVLDFEFAEFMLTKLAD